MNVQFPPFKSFLKATARSEFQRVCEQTTTPCIDILDAGLFDGFTYTIAFAIAFLGYEASTGLNPTQNVADLIKICILMWGGNNVTRPFRLAGAAALAPFMDRLMDRLQKRLRLPNKAFAFGLIVGLVAVICFSIIGSLFLSRWVRG